MSDTSQNGHKDGLTNKIIMSSVLIALFIPGIILLAILILKTIKKWRRRKLILSILGIFELIFIARVIQSLVFMLTQIFVTESAASDSFVRYWVQYIVLALHIVVITLLLLLWNNLICLVEDKFLNKKVKWGLLILNVFVCASTVLLLCILRPYDDHSKNRHNSLLFKEIVLSIILVAVILILPLYIMTWSRLRKVLLEINDIVTKRFSKRIGIFSIVLISVFLIRIILEIVILFVKIEKEITIRTLEFFSNSFPELVLTYSFIGLTWKGILAMRTHGGETELTDQDL